MPAEPADPRIRNRRYRPWFEVVLTVLFVSFVVATCVSVFLLGSNRKLAGVLFFGGGLGMTAIGLYSWLLQADMLRGRLPDRRTTVRAVFRRAVLGIRGAELPRDYALTTLAVFGWLFPVRHVVPYLTVGDALGVEKLARFPPAAIRRVRLAPDPAEDYDGSERPSQLCEVTVEMGSGKQLLLYADAADTDRLREWAAGKGVVVCDEVGQRPPTPRGL
jgi:hypothetical protein